MVGLGAARLEAVRPEAARAAVLGVAPEVAQGEFRVELEALGAEAFEPRALPHPRLQTGNLLP